MISVALATGMNDSFIWLEIGFKSLISLPYHFTVITGLPHPSVEECLSPPVGGELVVAWPPPVSILGLLSDLTRKRTDLIVENTLLRQQLIVLKRQIKRSQLMNSDRFFAYFFMPAL